MRAVQLPERRSRRSRLLRWLKLGQNFSCKLLNCLPSVFHLRLVAVLLISHEPYHVFSFHFGWRQMNLGWCIHASEKLLVDCIWLPVGIKLWASCMPISEINLQKSKANQSKPNVIPHFESVISFHQLFNMFSNSNHSPHVALKSFKSIHSEHKIQFERSESTT